MENRNPLPDGQGKIYLAPANMVNAADYVRPPANPEPQPTKPPSTEPNPDAVSASLLCVKDNVERMLRCEVEAIRNAAKKPKQFLHLVDAFYESHQIVAERTLAPSLKVHESLTGCGEAIKSQFVDGRDELLELSGNVSAADLPSAVER